MFEWFMLGAVVLLSFLLGAMFMSVWLVSSLMKSAVSGKRINLYGKYYTLMHLLPGQAMIATFDQDLIARAMRITPPDEIKHYHGGIAPVDMPKPEATILPFPSPKK